MIDEILLIKEVSMMVAMVYTFTQSLKMAGIPSKYAPLIAIATGIGLAFLFNYTLVWGVIAGIGASGVYSQMKTAAPPKDPEDFV